MHDYTSVRDTFARWWPKVKAGGLIGGHDFCVANAFPRADILTLCRSETLFPRRTSRRAFALSKNEPKQPRNECFGILW